MALRTDLPLVLVPDREPLRSPTLLEAAGALGLHVEAEQPLYDVCIVGGGPAGLAAGVYAASEGLSTVIVEREAPGGQAGQSSAIENYLGFPKGLSGSDLAQRALAQVSRFGAELVLAREVIGLEQRGTVRAVLLEGGGEVEARVGRRLHRRLLPPARGRGRRAAAPARASTTARPRRRPVRRPATMVYVVGGANSAGQAALNFARHAKQVTLVVRGSDLLATMSTYLVDRITAAANITVRCAHRGRRPPTATTTSSALTLVERGSGQREEVEASLAVRVHRRVAAHRLAR